MSNDDHELRAFMQDVGQGRLSRAELLRRAAVAGFAVSATGVLSAGAGRALASTGVSPAGTMRIGCSFSASDNYDPQASQSSPGRFRQWNVFSHLFEFNNQGRLVAMLAEEAVSNKNATVWTIRIKQGITWHDGSPFTADDVVYSLKRILDPATKAEGAGQISMVDGNGITKIDAQTVRVPLKFPFSTFPSQLIYYVSMVKNGATSFKPPVGTGPFKFESGDAQSLVLVKNPNYFVTGLPRLDRVEFVNIADSTARLNALKTGEIDAVFPTDATQVAAARSDPNLQIFVNKSASFLPLYMNSKKKPFSDNRVREALKYATNRQKMNTIAYSGKGIPGNDMFGITDPGYPKGVPQRAFDPERARSLWKQAGMSGKRVELWTADVFSGQVSSDLAFGQEAKKAGINVVVRTVPSDQFFSKVYGIKPFANDYWYLFPILTLMSSAFIPKATYEYVSSWTSPRTTKLFRQAAAETNSKKRNELVSELMRYFKDNGPYIIWAHEASPDLYAKRIGGQETSAVRNLNGFRFEKYFTR